MFSVSSSSPLVPLRGCDSAHMYESSRAVYADSMSLADPAGAAFGLRGPTGLPLFVVCTVIGGCCIILGFSFVWSRNCSCRCPFHCSKYCFVLLSLGAVENWSLWLLSWSRNCVVPVLLTMLLLPWCRCFVSQDWNTWEMHHSCARVQLIPTCMKMN